MALSPQKRQAHNPVLLQKGRSQRLDAKVAEDRELLEELAEEFHPGMRVKAIHFEDYEGVVRFIGNTLLGPGPWIGIELDEPVGRTNGSIAGVFYFDCADNHGAFVPPDCVEPIDELDGDLAHVAPAWGVEDHHFLDAHERTKDARAMASMASPLAKYAAASGMAAGGGGDYGSDVSGASHEYFTTLPPKLRSSPAAAILSPGAKRGGGGGRPGAVHPHIMTRRVGDKGGMSPVGTGGTPPHLRNHAALRSTVPYYEAFAPVRKEPEVGQRVRVKGNLGVIKFVGGTLFEFGQWVGVELDEPIGKNSGSVNGTHYFKCKPSHGIFVRPSRVEWLPWEFAPLPDNAPGSKSGRKKRRKKERHGAAIFREQSESVSSDSEDEEEEDETSSGNKAGAGAGAGEGGAEAAQQPVFRSPSQGPPPSILFEEVDGVLHMASGGGGGGESGGQTLAPSGQQQGGSGGSGGAGDESGDASFFGAGDAASGAHAILAAPHSPEFEFGCSDMKFYQLDSKIQGLFYGYFVGSAVGLTTENAPPAYIQSVLGSGDPYEAVRGDPDGHRANWYSSDEPGGVWGVDGDASFVLLDALVASGGRVDYGEFAAKLAAWGQDGVGELAQIAPIGMEETVFEILSQPDFVSQPLAVAKNVYFKNGKSFADNGAVARAPLLALSDFWDLDRVAANATIMTQVTHADPRCVASAIAVNIAIALLLQKSSRSHTEKGLIFVLKKAFKYAKAVGVPDEGALKAAIMTATPASLRLGDSKTSRHTYKALGAGFYALRTGVSFEETLAEIAACGGDADANCAVAGALLGVKLGRWRVPADWPPKSLPYTERTWPPVDGQFASVVSEEPESGVEVIPAPWLAIRGTDVRAAEEKWVSHLGNLKLTIETYSTKRDY